VNRDSCDMVRVATIDDVLNGPPGAFCWETQPDEPYRVLWSKAPGGIVSCLPVMPVPPGVTAWNWDGNEDRPTLTPYIHHWQGMGGDGEWHGFYTAGRMVSC
jgi:hypothetical protein